MSEISTPSWFKTIVSLAILWNLAGIFNFYLGVSITPEQINELTESERNRLNGSPLWTTIAFAIGVFGGLIGSVGLFLKKAWAMFPLLISLIAVFSQMSYGLFFTSAVESNELSKYLLPILTILVAYLLLRLCNNGIKKGYIV